jgi:hypothetical protein
MSAEVATEGLPWETTPRLETHRITLCGSTKFRGDYELWNKRLTLAGFLVYSVSGFGHGGDNFTDEEKARLDQVHLAKIDASHSIVVINPGGYIGESTTREIAHAKRAGKSIFYTHSGDQTVYRLRTGPDGATSMRYRAFNYGEAGEAGRPALPSVIKAAIDTHLKVKWVSAGDTGGYQWVGLDAAVAEIVRGIERAASPVDPT